MTPPKRMQTQTERDVSGLEAKRKREAEQLAVPHEVDDPVTGQYVGPELDEKRDERDNKTRFRRLEHRADAGDRERDELRARNNELLDKILKMSGIKFESNTTIIEANATFWRRNGERFAAAVIGLVAAIGAYFLGRKS